MREDDEFRHFVPLLRRIIILVAVIIAVPVILWTITAFVRTYVGPPHIPTFHQLASTASINAPPANASPEATAQLQTAMQQAGMTNSASSSVADARASDAAATKGSLLSDRGTEGDATAQGTPRAEVFPPSPPAAPDGAATPGSVTAGPAATGTDDAGEAVAASPPLTGPVPLPRRRPRDAESMRTADIAPSHVPMPRPRPDGAGAGAPAETTGSSPIGFIQNLFH